MAESKQEAAQGANGASGPGRPSKLTPKTRARILKLIRGGNRRTAAARAAGVSEATFFRWMADTRPMYQRFRAEVERAEAEFEAELVDIVVTGAPESPQLAWRMLETRSGEWRRAKLPPEPEPVPPPPPTPEPPEPLPAIILTPDEFRQVLHQRMRAERGEPADGADEDDLDSLGGLVEQLGSTTPSAPFRLAQDMRGEQWPIRAVVSPEPTKPSE